MKEHFDLLVRHADVVDGTGAPRYSADVGVRKMRIVKIGDLSDATADTDIDATGLIVSPGFIDSHTHDDRLMLSDGDMAPKVSQGVTTIVGGNCGISLAPMPRAIPDPVTPPLDLLDGTGEWFKFGSFKNYLDLLEAQPAATNCAMLVGHSTLRVATMSDLQRPATPEEIVAMQALVEEALQAGAIGVSTGLAYPPSASATTQEIIEVCRPLAAHGSIYCSHIRDEGDTVMESLEEAFQVGREVGIPVVISHHKVVGTQNHGRSVETLEFIQSQMKKQPICLDCYPYAASSTILSADLCQNATRVVITWSKSLPKMAGKDLSDIEVELGLSRDETIERLQPAGAIFFRMDDADVQRILQFDETMIGSDGLPHDEKPHPRLWGSFPRVLGHYGRGLGLFTLEKAVHKMTGLTAARFGLAERGEIKTGHFADLTIFNAETVNEGGSFANPVTPSIGIEAVVVNGAVVWRDGKPSGARPGKVLRRTNVHA